MLALTSLAIGLAAVASAIPTRKRAPAQIVTQCTVPNTVALTFDDGPYIFLQEISEQLLAAGAHGTFFFNGFNWGCIYSEEAAARIQYAYGAGHQIASHTWSHAHLAQLDEQQVRAEMSRIDEALETIVGVTPAFFRPPYGEYNDLVLEIAGERGQSVALWDFDSGDSSGLSPAESNRRYDDVVQRHPGTILALNHEVHEPTVKEILPHAIQVLQNAGYRLVTLAECLGQPAYLKIGFPTPRDGSWTC